MLACLAALAVFRPASLRLAARNGSRRGWDALLVVICCAVGTAVITSALAVGDSLDASIRARVPETLGPIDAVMSSYSPTTAEVAEAVLRADPPRASDGLLGAVTSGATLATPEDEPGARGVLPTARLVEIDFDEADALGPPNLTGISGPTPGPGEVVLGRDAARNLGVGPGEPVEVYSYGESRRLRVDRVLARVGVAGYRGPFDADSSNAFVAPGTVSEMSFPGLFAVEAAPPENLLFVSAAGGLYPGPGRSEDLLDGIRGELEPRLGSDYELGAVKGDLLRDAEEQGEEFGELFLSLASFAVAAGAALLVNALVALAGGGGGCLGVLRALGMGRADLAGAFVLEVAFYAVLGGVLGALSGLGVAALAVRLAGGVFSTATRGSVEAMRFGFEPTTPLAGVLAGTLISLAVAAVAAAWISRLPIAAAIGGTPAPRKPRPPGAAVATLFLLFASAALLSAALARSGEGFGALVFPCAALVLLALYLDASVRRAGGGRLPAWLLVDAVAAVAMLWVVLAFPLLTLGGDAAAPFVAQGLVLTGGAVVLAVRHAPRAGSLLGRLGGGLAPRLALAYPSERRLRTGVTLLAYALIVFTLVFSSVLSSVFSAGVGELAEDEGGGFDLLVTTGTAGPVDPARLGASEGVAGAATLRWTVAGFRVGASGAFEDWAISGFGDDLLRGGPPALQSFDRSRYPGEAAVWEAVRADPTLAVADVAFLEEGGGPSEENVAVGDIVQVRAAGTGRTVEREVVAISAAGAAFSGVMVSKGSLAAFAENPAGNRHYVEVAEGFDPEAVARRLEREFLTRGLRARPFEGVVREALRGQEAFFGLIEGYLAIGLFVGVAGLGVSMIRAARERRHAVGVLRALGAPASTLRAALLAESGLVALTGVLIGASLALVTGYGLAAGSSTFEEANAALDVPWARLALLVLGVLLASLLVALPAVLRVARTRPADALRGTEEGPL